MYDDSEDNINYRTMEIGTIIDGKVYYIEYVADADKYSKYFPTEEAMFLHCF